MDSERILRKDGRLYSRCRGEAMSFHGEGLMEIDGINYREWIPWRSKLGALLKKREDIEFPEGDILYLGAAQGTTVSHISDITEGIIYAVEFSKVAFRKLATLSRKRDNIIPILADAFKPETYRNLVPVVDILYQDVSQKDQTGMLTRNAEMFLGKGGTSFLMLKARSVDVTASPEQIYEMSRRHLHENGFGRTEIEDLSPFQKDHAAIISGYGP